MFQYVLKTVLIPSQDLNNFIQRKEKELIINH